MKTVAFFFFRSYHQCMTNPFTLSAGIIPEQFISRSEGMSKLLNNFTSEKSVTNAVLLTGARGIGKTVLLNKICEKLCQSKDWIVIKLNSNEDLMFGFASQLYNNRILHPLCIKASFNFSVLGIGFEVSGSDTITDLQTAIFRMLDIAKEKHLKVMIAVDEIINDNSSRKFTTMFQQAGGDGYPVYTLMTGLYENINKLENGEKNSFLRRIPKTILNSLPFSDVAASYRKILNLSPKDASFLAKLTNGYPFGYQVLGYLCHENHSIINKQLIEDYDSILRKTVYDRTWETLSKREKEILKVYSSSPDFKIKTANIIDQTNITAESFSRYREQLIQKGLVYGLEKGYSCLALPRFREFVNDISSGIFHEKSSKDIFFGNNSFNDYDF